MSDELKTVFKKTGIISKFAEGLRKTTENLVIAGDPTDI
jgi:hypothetical protein